MDLFKLLQQLKSIGPDPEYKESSRRLILGPVLKEEVAPRTPLEIILHSLQFGSAVALAALLIILTLGGFSAWRVLSPLQISSLDPSSLRAEAEAIDVQIELTDIVYSEPTGEETTPQTVAPEGDVQKQAQAQAEDLGLKTASPDSEAQDRLSLDEALDKLAQ